MTGKKNVLTAISLLMYCAESSAWSCFCHWQNHLELIKISARVGWTEAFKISVNEDLLQETLQCLTTFSNGIQTPFVGKLFSVYKPTTWCLTSCFCI